MSRYCLDTSAYSHFQKGHAEVTQLIDEADWLGMPSVVLGELWMGFNLGSILAKNQRVLESFLASPFVEEIDVSDGVARNYGEIAAELRRAGTPMPTNDIWIAACAATTGSIVLTFDEHFRIITRIGSIVLKPESRLEPS